MVSMRVKVTFFHCLFYLFLFYFISFIYFRFTQYEPRVTCTTVYTLTGRYKDMIGINGFPVVFRLICTTEQQQLLQQKETGELKIQPLHPMIKIKPTFHNRYYILKKEHDLILLRTKPIS